MPIKDWIIKKLIAKEMEKMWDKIKGKKSYAVALATVMFAIGGAATNQFTWQHALELILASGAVVGLRNAIPPVK